MSTENNYIKRVVAEKIYGRFDIEVEFQRNINVLYGRNGTGKTTLLHILSNALNGDFNRFAFLEFKRIYIELDRDILTIERFSSAKGEEEEIVVTINNEEMGRFSTKDHRQREAKRVLALEEGEDAELLVSLFGEESEKEEKTPLLEVAYFPAFRTMIDAWASARERREFRYRASERWSSLATHSARRWFGDFVPSVVYPSLLEIEYKLSDEINRARLTIGKADRELLSRAFLRIFASLSKTGHTETDSPEEILTSLKLLFDKLQESPLQEESTLVSRVYGELWNYIKDLSLDEKVEGTTVRVLRVYREILEEIIKIQEEAFVGIQRYLHSVNEFLEDKQLFIDPTIPRYARGRVVGIRFNDGNTTSGLRSLSSGERQIITLIYAATHMSSQKVALIDEPEISLHVDWQRKLLKSMSEQIGNRQIIACTHSPVIAADYPESQQELGLLIR